MRRCTFCLKSRNVPNEDERTFFWRKTNRNKGHFHNESFDRQRIQRADREKTNGRGRVESVRRRDRSKRGIIVRLLSYLSPFLFFTFLVDLFTFCSSSFHPPHSPPLSLSLSVSLSLSLPLPPFRLACKLAAVYRVHSTAQHGFME